MTLSKLGDNDRWLLDPVATNLSGVYKCYTWALKLDGYFNTQKKDRVTTVYLKYFHCTDLKPISKYQLQTMSWTRLVKAIVSSRLVVVGLTG